MPANVTRRETPYIIAEIGASHEADYAVASHLITVAQVSDCQAVKFQYYDAERLAKQRNCPHAEQRYRDFQVPLGWLGSLKEKANLAGLDFVVSVYDIQGLQEAQQFADVIKISSFEMRDEKLIDEAVSIGKPLIISAGMATEQDISRLRCIRVQSQLISVLHCISAYPAKTDQLNLDVIRRYSLDGFSDHSGQRITGAVAVSCGARILEVHIRDFNTPSDNPDFAHSLTPSKLRDYVLFARQARQMVGIDRRLIVDGEQPNTKYRTVQR